MYCELKNKEIELYETSEKHGGKDRIVRECSGNYKNINGVKFLSPCPLRLDKKCLQFQNRIE